MGNELSAESNKPDVVVSVRFATDEVAELRGLADANGIPLSTLIRRVALRALTWTPAVANMQSSNEAPVASGWETHQTEEQYGWPTASTSASLTYSSPGLA